MKNMFFLCLYLLLIWGEPLDATVRFANRESAFVLCTDGDGNQARLRAGPVSSFVGWRNGSIISYLTGVGEGDYNLRNHTALNGSDHEASAATVSGSLVYHNSNALCYYAPMVRNNSYWLRVNSNALVYHQRITSNAVKVLDVNVRTHSNAFTYNVRIHSNAIHSLDARVSIVQGPHEEISTSTYALSNDLYLNADNPLTVSTTSIIDGGGNAMWFAQGQTNVLIIEDGVTVTLNNVILKNFDDTAIQLIGSGSVIFGSGTVVELAAPTSLHRNWTFAGTTRINGFGNKLSLSFFNLGILQPGTLTLQDVVLDELKSNKLRCIGGNASLVLRDSELLMANNMSFTAGSLQFEHDVKITGSNIFSYETVGQSTIATKSRLFLDFGVTFSYSPRAAQGGLLRLTDATSQLYLNGCTLKMTTTGMQLTKGTVFIDHKNSVYNNGATSMSEAFKLGNGTAADDLTIEVLPGGNIELLTGRMVYANAQ